MKGDRIFKISAGLAAAAIAFTFPMSATAQDSSTQDQESRTQDTQSAQGTGTTQETRSTQDTSNTQGSDTTRSTQGTTTSGQDPQSSQNTQRSWSNQSTTQGSQDSQYGTQSSQGATQPYGQQGTQWNSSYGQQGMPSQQGAQPMGQDWIRVGVDFDSDGQADSFEFIHVADFQRARSMSQQRLQGQYNGGMQGQAGGQWSSQTEPGQWQNYGSSQRFDARTSQGRYDPYASSGQQSWYGQSNQGDAYARPMSSRQVEGEVEDTLTIRLSGLNEPHVLAKVEKQDGRIEHVDLGPESKVQPLDLDDGDRVRISGVPGSINGRPLLVATQIQSQDQTIYIQPQPTSRRMGQPDWSQGQSGWSSNRYGQSGQQYGQYGQSPSQYRQPYGDQRTGQFDQRSTWDQQSSWDQRSTSGQQSTWGQPQGQMGQWQYGQSGQTQSIQGQVTDVRRLAVDQSGQEHLLVKVQTADGSSKVLDLGRADQLTDVDIKSGQRVQAQGTPTQISGNQAFQAQQLQVDGQTVELPTRSMSSTGTFQQNQFGTSGSQWQQGGTDNVEFTIQSWPEDARKAAEEMIQKYGQPDGVTPNMIEWHGNSPWVRTIVHKDGVQHDTPKPHMDVLEQVVKYEVPADKIGDLAEFDGSISVNRTAGEVTVRCDKEAANILALNLMHQIVSDELDVEEAKQTLDETVQALEQGQKPQLTQQLTFEVESSSPSGQSRPTTPSTTTPSTEPSTTDRPTSTTGDEDGSDR